MTILNHMLDILDEPVEIRLHRAKDPTTSAEELRQLSQDPFWFVRDFVASNLSTPEDCLCALMKDHDFRISCDAKKTLYKKRAALSLEQKITIAKETANHADKQGREGLGEQGRGPL